MNSCCLEVLFLQPTDWWAGQLGGGGRGALTQRGVGAGREVPRRPGLAHVPVFGHRRCVYVHVATGTLQGSRGDSALRTRRDWRGSGGWVGAGREEGGRWEGHGWRRNIYTSPNTTHAGRAQHSTGTTWNQRGGWRRGSGGWGGMDRVQANVHGGDGGHVSRRAHARPSISV